MDKMDRLIIIVTIIIISLCFKGFQRCCGFASSSSLKSSPVLHLKNLPNQIINKVGDFIVEAISDDEGALKG